MLVPDDADQYSEYRDLRSDLALWFGFPVSDLGEVLPNINRFYTPGSGSPPMGFLL
jgi:hypothetical protein